LKTDISKKIKQTWLDAKLLRAYDEGGYDKLVQLLVAYQLDIEGGYYQIGSEDGKQEQV
jgi:hypothetical protein